MMMMMMILMMVLMIIMIIIIMITIIMITIVIMPIIRTYQLPIIQKMMIFHIKVSKGKLLLDSAVFILFNSSLLIDACL